METWSFPFSACAVFIVLFSGLFETTLIYYKVENMVLIRIRSN
jgi:hypothetical protein